MTKKESKSSFKRRKKLNPKFVRFVKIVLILILIFGIYYNNQTFTNKISLLAVSENSKGDISGGSTIDLKLKIKPGSGQTFVNLNSIEEVDTQISIINSQKIACELFELDCDSYDFFYEFDGSALVLKGPSASSAIAVLTAKTMNKENVINDKIAITGSLNSGGLIGNVGGVDEKIKVAKDNGFEKVLIPVFSEYDEANNNSDIEVIKVLDIVEAYNIFSGKKYVLKTPQINRDDYDVLMQKLADFMCSRAVELKNEINSSNIDENSSLISYLKSADNSYNSSLISYENGDFYSAGSFCFNSNVNYRNIVEAQKNLSYDNLVSQINGLKKELDLKYLQINSDDYKEKIRTINDFYSYLIINDRLDEARDLVEQSEKFKLDIKDDIVEIIVNQTEGNVSLINQSDVNESVIEVDNSLIQINESDLIDNDNNNLREEYVISQKRGLYSYAIERYYTQELWEQFISNKGDKIKFSEDKVQEACMNLLREIQIKSQLLENYNINYLNEEINKQLEYQTPFNNQYLCIYKGLQLNGKINTLLNSVGIDDNRSKEYTNKIVEFTTSRVSLNSNGNFPLIPFIYAEYAKNLANEDNIGSSMLYSNYALSYLDLNLLLEKDEIKKTYFNIVVNDLFNNYVFLISMLILIGFLG